MKKRKALLVIASICTAAVISGCGGSSSVNYKDGTYEGESEVYTNDDGSEDGNGYGVVSITIENNLIVDCTYKTYEPDGTLKDEDYGKEGGVVANRDYYNKAQKAIAACDEYASQLSSSGSLDGIDAITGATINYNEFVEAVNNALDKAKSAE